MLNSNFLFSSVHSINSYSYLSLHDALPILFFTEVRYGGLAITYNISASLFGGTTPLLISWLINITANKLMPAYYIIFARSEEHTSELQSRGLLVCRILLYKKK